MEIGSRVVLTSLMLSLSAEFPEYLICSKVSCPDQSGFTVLPCAAGVFRNLSGLEPAPTFPPMSGGWMAGGADAGNVVVCCAADVEGIRGADDVTISCNTSK